MDKEVSDIIGECIRPNFVELPEVIEQLPTPALRGLCQPPDTDREDESLGEEEEAEGGDGGGGAAGAGGGKDGKGGGKDGKGGKGEKGEGKAKGDDGAGATSVR